jgi:hypothetical protein
MMRTNFAEGAGCPYSLAEMLAVPFIENVAVMMSVLFFFNRKSNECTPSTV